MKFSIPKLILVWATEAWDVLRLVSSNRWPRWAWPDSDTALTTNTACSPRRSRTDTSAKNRTDGRNTELLCRFRVQTNRCTYRFMDAVMRMREPRNGAIRNWCWVLPAICRSRATADEGRTI